MYLDSTSIKFQGAYRTAWTKAVPLTGDVRELLSFTLYDCPGQRTAVKNLIAYKRDGTNRSYTWADFELTWDQVAPDTMGEGAFKAICQ